MPEVEHRNQPSLTAAPALKQESPATTTAASSIASAGITAAQLEETIKKVLNRTAEEKQQAAPVEKPAELDWSKITEKDITNLAVNIPVIEHDIPSYMDVVLKDNEYMCVWASKHNVRLGQLLAEGYEFLKPEHVHPDFKLPLVRFSSDGNYEYHDVVCMRVHKRILLGKRRKALEISMRQLKRVNKPPQSKLTKEEDFKLDNGLSYYDPEIGSIVQG